MRFESWVVQDIYSELSPKRFSSLQIWLSSYFRLDVRSGGNKDIRVVHRFFGEGR